MPRDWPLDKCARGVQKCVCVGAVLAAGIHPSIGRSVHPVVCLPACLPAFLPACLPACLPVRPPAR
eukprot:6634292-Alexandrium_andersonii.AAC.1